jgi:ribosomal protein S18 acetylase RimI-like enzyme
MTPVRCADRSLKQILRAMQCAYEGYVIPMNFSLENVQQRFRQDGVDLLSSWIFETGDQPAGVLIIARRGTQARVAAIGFAPRFRREGHGRSAMTRAIREAKERLDSKLVLEVFQTNEAAVALYRHSGLKVARILRSYRSPPGNASPAAVSELSELSPAEAAAFLARFSDRNLPWQLQPETFAGAISPVRGFSLGLKATALVQQTPSSLRLLSLAVGTEHRRKGRGSALLAAIRSRFPDMILEMPPILEDGASAAFLRANGWTPGLLDQLEMAIDLNAPEVAPLDKPPWQPLSLAR